MRNALLVTLLSFALAGCPEKKSEEPLAKPTPSAEQNASPPKPTAPDRGKQAEATLARWLAAQNDGKLDEYIALYDASFEGVRRTGGGVEKTLDLEGWRKDREKLFAKKQEVAADKVVQKVDGDRVSLTFVQRWRSGTYADHGEKVLELRAFGAALRIVREEQKWSERGWDDAKDTPFDATDLVSPIAMTVEKVRKPDNGDCSETTLRVHLDDAKGTKKHFDHGTITGMGGSMTAKGGPLAPKGGEYTDLGVYCAGLQQGYTVKVTGDTVVALAIWMDEEAGPGKDSKVIAKLPAGAKVVTK